MRARGLERLRVLGAPVLALSGIAIGGLLAELTERAGPVGCCDDAKARHLQGGSDQQSGTGIVVHDQHRGGAVGLIVECVHRFLLSLRVTITRHWVTVRAPGRRKNPDIRGEFSPRSARPG